jgi:hypothetical protein
MRCTLAEFMPPVAVAVGKASVITTVPVGVRNVVSNTMVRCR